MNKFWWWVWRNEWIPLGRLAPYVLGLTAKEANLEVRTMLNELGIEVVKNGRK